MSRLHLAIVLSVVLNVFLSAVLIAGVVTLRTDGRMIAAGSLRVAGAELPRIERRQFRMALRETRRSMRPTIAAARAAKAEAAGLLQQPNLNQAAVNAALDRARVADMAVRAAVERRAVAFAATLPPTERSKLANAMNRRAGKALPATD